LRKLQLCVKCDYNAFMKAKVACMFAQALTARPATKPITQLLITFCGFVAPWVTLRRPAQCVRVPLVKHAHYASFLSVHSREPRERSHFSGHFNSDSFFLIHRAFTQVLSEGHSVSSFKVRGGRFFLTFHIFPRLRAAFLLGLRWQKEAKT
jgi:hypothetical protein